MKSTGLTFCTLMFALAGAAFRTWRQVQAAGTSVIGTTRKFMFHTSSLILDKVKNTSARPNWFHSLCAGPLWAQKMTLFEEEVVRDWSVWSIRKKVLVASDARACWLIGLGDKWRHTPEIHLIQFPLETRIECNKTSAENQPIPLQKKAISQANPVSFSQPLHLVDEQEKIHVSHQYMVLD